MKVTTDSTVTPQITVDTERDDAFRLGEDTARETWRHHCEGDTVDEAALYLATNVMEQFVTEDLENGTAYAYGLIRGLLRKSRKPEGAPVNMEGASQ
ncbi:hypothetical protein HNP33_002040 [Comamonas odontotermitis]|uniref:Uncharacterized protein n=1 Tax=Comamonas odontotermitis TaxID=379895 RepID=A0ABR6RFN6_9BURK|nr:hypothetical protein [Comamonas odontotermitis]MBB6577972.1 hypothetical protein [Comamonas odontotermitis]